MFTQKCFISKNTPELKKKLTRLGYLQDRDPKEDDWCISTIIPYVEVQGKEGLWVVCQDEDGTFRYEKGVFRSWNWDIYTALKEDNVNIIDCGTNEEMFLALAALRDDSDKNQWFVYKDKWFICDVDSIEDEREKRKSYYQGAWYHLSHKATPQEIVEHFKGKII